MINKVLVTLLVGCMAFYEPQQTLPDSPRAKAVRERVWSGLQYQLYQQGVKHLTGVYLRLFKEEHQLEVWAKGDSDYRLIKVYKVCYFSGGLGTKTSNGDGKSPEGFYTLAPAQLNPVSNYHLALNIGYPNVLECHLHYTGSAIMIHGDCVSIGCYAMTDDNIDEIYTYVYKALAAGQAQVAVHIFPFKMSDANLLNHRKAQWQSSQQLWQMMQPVYRVFEATHQVPVVTVERNRYVLGK